jgi:hypothetical protein
MKLILFSSGLELEVPIAGEKKGRARAVQAFERENAARESGDSTGHVQPRHGTFLGQLTQLSAAPDAASPEAMAHAVYAEMEGDIIGPGVRAKLRRMVCRKANEAWIAEQKRRPGGRTAAEYAQFQKTVDDGTEAAVRAYAKLIGAR